MPSEIMRVATLLLAGARSVAASKTDETAPGDIGAWDARTRGSDVLCSGWGWHGVSRISHFM